MIAANIMSPPLSDYDSEYSKDYGNEPVVEAHPIKKEVPQRQDPQPKKIFIKGKQAMPLKIKLDSIKKHKPID